MEEGDSPRGSGSADGDVEMPTYQLDKNNLMTAFFNNGKEMKEQRIDDFGNNLFLGEYHVFALAETSPELITMLENTGKYKACRAPGTDLVCFVHTKYYENLELVAHGGPHKSKYAIFRIRWDGRVGGVTETVLAVFHLNYFEAHKAPNQGYSQMNNRMNLFMRNFAMDVIKWRARIVMGDGNMACYAIEDAFAYHGLVANTLAFHTEYVREKDLHELTSKDPRQLKWDSCAIWSIGPITKIFLQGPAKHCLAAALWPQRVDGKGTTRGCPAKSYKRVVPTHLILGLTHWPHLTEEIYETCKRWREQIAKEPARDCETGAYRVAPAALIDEYVKLRKSIPSLRPEPRDRKGVPEAVDTNWPSITQSREFVSDWAKADPHANMWSKGGHFGLKVILNFDKTGRDYGTQGKKRLRVGGQKKDQWMQTNVWPWWIESETEAHHWSAKVVGRDLQGGQCDGLFWRHARAEWLQSGKPDAAEKLEEYDMPWIAAYGAQAMADALRDTEEAYQQSLARGDTLQSLTEAAKRDGAVIAAKKAAAIAAKKAAEQAEGRRARDGREDDKKRRRPNAWSGGTWSDRSWGSGSWGVAKERHSRNEST